MLINKLNNAQVVELADTYGSGPYAARHEGSNPSLGKKINMENKIKHIWIFLSSFGVFFAFLSWIQEILTRGFWWKGALAIVLGFILYKLVINKV